MTCVAHESSTIRHGVCSIGAGHLVPNGVEREWGRIPGPQPRLHSTEPKTKVRWPSDQMRVAIRPNRRFVVAALVVDAWSSYVKVRIQEQYLLILKTLIYLEL